MVLMSFPEPIGFAGDGVAEFGAVCWFAGEAGAGGVVEAAAGPLLIPVLADADGPPPVLPDPQ